MNAKEHLQLVFAQASEGPWVEQDGCIYAKGEDGQGQGELICDMVGDPDDSISEQDVYNIKFILAAQQHMPMLLEALEALESARWALLSLSNEASNLAEFHPEVNETWNKGGEAYEASRKVRAVIDKIGLPVKL